MSSPRGRGVDLGSTASVLGARVMLAYAASHGVDVDALLAEVGLTRRALDDPEGRLPLARYRRCWELAAARARDPLFGLHVAERSTVGTYEALDYALWVSADFADALARATRFYRLLGDDLALHLIQRDGLARLHRDVVHDQRHRAEAFFAVVVLRARELLAAPFRVREVRFAHRARGDARAYRALFRCPVRFGCALAELVFDAGVLRLPVRTAKPGLARVLDRHMRDLVGRLPAGDSFLHRVHHAIARSLQGARPSLRSTAIALHASPRTVQRRLHELGATHREVVEHVRRDMAERLLATGRLSIGEIAYLLGYRDSGGFRRAYRRWTCRRPSSSS
jgi:AraC-like DNA-binding protein